MKIFSGSSNRNLSNKVAKVLGISLSKAEVVRFDNSEVRVRIMDDVENDVCVVIQSTANPTDTNIMELFLFCDALKRQQARKVYAVIPYFGYARQNIQHRDGECVSVNVIISFLEAIGFDKVFTFDLHDRATEGVFSIPFKHLSATSLLADELKKILTNDNKRNPSPDSVAIVSPDQGGIELARNFGRHFFDGVEFELSVVEKRRNYDAIHTSESLGLYGNVSGKIAIIVDDMVTSGGTLIQAADLCLKNNAHSVFAAVTHPDLGKNTCSKLSSSAIKRIVVTDTIEPFYTITSDMIVSVSVCDMIASELRTIS